MHKVLRGTCLYCHRFRAPDEDLAKYEGALQFLEYGMVQQADAITREHPRGVSIGELLSDATDMRSRKDKDANKLTQEDGDASAIRLGNGGQARETIAQFVERMKKHVRDTIQAYTKEYPLARSRDQDNSTFDRRRDFIHSFFIDISKRKRCPHCQAYV